MGQRKLGLHRAQGQPQTLGTTPAQLLWPRYYPSNWNSTGTPGLALTRSTLIRRSTHRAPRIPPTTQGTGGSLFNSNWANEASAVRSSAWYIPPPDRPSSRSQTPTNWFASNIQNPPHENSRPVLSLGDPNGTRMENGKGGRLKQVKQLMDSERGDLAALLINVAQAGLRVSASLCASPTSRASPGGLFQRAHQRSPH
jgi:hypothetical protein